MGLPEKVDPRNGSRYEYYEKLAKADGVNLMTDSKVIRKGKKEGMYRKDLNEEIITKLIELLKAKGGLK